MWLLFTIYEYLHITEDHNVVGQKLFRACVISVVISIPTLNKTYYYYYYYLLFHWYQ